jgi:hypothetical protein
MGDRYFLLEMRMELWKKSFGMNEWKWASTLISFLPLAKILL